MKPGSEQWFEQRDQLRLECANGDEQAVAFLSAIGSYVELWDDLIDEDRDIPKDEIHTTLANGLIDIAVNPFVARNQEFIGPVFAMMISAYLTSEELRSDPDVKVRQRAFHIRNYPLELYNIVALLTGGMTHMIRMEPEVRRFFAFEAFEDWEFANG